MEENNAVHTSPEKTFLGIKELSLLHCINIISGIIFLITMPPGPFAGFKIRYLSEYIIFYFFLFAFILWFITLYDIHGSIVDGSQKKYAILD